MNNPYLECLASFGIGGAHPGGLQLTKYILSKENINKETSLLDVGCGTGQTSAYIAQDYQCSVTALDNNTTMLKKAKQRFSTLHLPIDLMYGSIEKLPFQDGIFDFVLSESVTSFANATLSLQEYKRVLKPNGILLAIEMILEKSPSDDEVDTLINFYGVSQLLTESEWYDLIQKAGFSHVIIDHFNPALNKSKVESAADFAPSQHIDDKYLQILERHEQFIKTYDDVLGFRIFRCI